VYHDAVALEKLLNQKIEKLKKNFPTKPGAIRLKLKPSSTKLRLSLKPKAGQAEQAPEESEQVVESVAESIAESVAEPKTEEEMVEEAVQEEDTQEDGEKEIPETEQQPKTEGEGQEDENNEQEDMFKHIVEEVKRRPEGKTVDDAIIKKVVIASVIPVTSRYLQTKNPIPPPQTTDVFQATIAASRTHIIQSHVLTLPSWHHTINLNVVLHESLNVRHHSVTLNHNERLTLPLSSSTSNPWADTAKPLKSRYELRLISGLNLINIDVHAAPAAPRGLPARHAVQSTAQWQSLEGSEHEKFTIWIMLQK
jgi:hypothetical protein